MVIIDTDKLAPAEAVTNLEGRRREARTLVQTVTTQMGEESTSVELVVRHDREAKAYVTTLRHHVDLIKPNGRRSIVFKLRDGIPSVRFYSTPAARYSAAKLDGLYEDAYGMLTQLVGDRNEHVIALLSEH
jgi:hypothetical protein